MYVRMHACMLVCLCCNYVCVYMYACTYVHFCTYVCKFAVYMYACMYACMYTYIYIYIYIYELPMHGMFSSTMSKFNRTNLAVFNT